MGPVQLERGNGVAVPPTNGHYDNGDLKGKRGKILGNILEGIGNTPMVRLNRIPQSEGIPCQMYAKCELYAPGGSHKDRIALRMVEEAEADGRLKPGSVIIEPTSGNTGVGVAMVAAVKGYECILVMPEKMSAEKHETMARLGAKVVRTGKNVLHTAVAKQIQKQTPNSVILDQYGNKSNPNAHYDQTAEEILDQVDGQLDMVVMGVGTGGIISGVGKKIKEKAPNCIVVGVDPDGSIMAQPDSINQTSTTFWEVEGIGHDWIPDVLDRSVVDHWVKCNDKETFTMARRIISEEGMLVGGSCGSAVAGAIKAAKHFGLKAHQKCVVVFPDSCRNYMTKFVSDQWMNERRFLEDDPVTKLYSWWEKPVSSLSNLSVVKISPDFTVSQAIKLMKRENLNQLPVVDSQGVVQGMVTLDHLIKKLTTMDINGAMKVEELLFHQYKRLDSSQKMAKLSYMLQASPFVLIFQPFEKEDDNGKTTVVEKFTGIVTSMIFAEFVIS